MIDGPPLPDGLRFDRAGRDTQRRPMQWRAAPGGGFTTGTPWMPLADPDVANVETQASDEGSLLSLYRNLLRLRHDSPALRRGAQRSIFGAAEDVLAWLREEGEERLLVLVNLADEPRRLRSAPLLRHGTGGDVVVATGQRIGTVDLGRTELEALEGVVVGLR
jgi:alpha-glucosidase